MWICTDILLENQPFVVNCYNKVVLLAGLIAVKTIIINKNGWLVGDKNQTPTLTQTETLTQILTQT